MQHLQLSLMSVCNHHGFVKPEGVIIPGHHCTVHTLIVDKEAQFGGDSGQDVHEAAQTH